MDKKITQEIKVLLALTGKKNVELAEYLGISAQSLQNKFNRGSFSADDLIKISDFAGGVLAITLESGDRVVFDKGCIRESL